MTDPIVVALISDTHGWLDPTLEPIFRDCALILHAGDVGHPDVLEELGRWGRTVAVRGNIDGGELASLPLTQVVEVGGKRIALLHIAGSPKRPNKAARTLIDDEKPDVFMVGHSHIPVAGRVRGTLWVNPGAAGRQGFHDERFAGLLRIDPVSGEIGLDRIHLGPRGELRRNAG